MATDYDIISFSDKKTMFMENYYRHFYRNIYICITKNKTLLKFELKKCKTLERNISPQNPKISRWKSQAITALPVAITVRPICARTKRDVYILYPNVTRQSLSLKAAGEWISARANVCQRICRNKRGIGTTFRDNKGGERPSTRCRDRRLSSLTQHHVWAFFVIDLHVSCTVIYFLTEKGTNFCQ